MNWLFPRVSVAVLITALGAMIGFYVGRSSGLPVLGTFLGALLGAALLALIETLRGERLLRWLREPTLETATRDDWLWGELVYRMERVLRAREQAAAEHKERLEQFLSAIQASPNGVLLLDRDEQIDWCNATAAVHFGLDPQRDLRQHITNLVRAPAFVAYLQSGDFHEPVTFPHRSGSGLLSVHIHPYGDGRKLLLSQDVTEKERAELMRRDFVANVSHEIRTPLTVLAGFIETLDHVPLTEPERARVLALMTQQTQRMQHLVSDLLTLAQLEGSPRPSADRWVSVDRLMAQAESEARTLSGGRHRLVFRAGGDAHISGNESELLSALSNLVSNAIRYTPENGTIEVSWQVLADGSGEFAVADNGIGIEKEHLPRLTERFYRVDGSRSRDTGGTGLGLSIVKHVLLRHGGRLDVDSKPGKGSTFRLVYPAARVRVVEAPSSTGTSDRNDTVETL